MFSSDRFQEAYYEGQRDFITYCAIIVIVFSIIYYLSVCIAEIAAGSDFMAFVQQHVCCCLCPDKEKIRRKNMAKRRARGELVDENPDEDEGATISLSANPLMAGSSEAQKRAETDAAAANVQLMKMKEQMRQLKKNQSTNKTTSKKKGRSGNKRTKGKTKKTMGQARTSKKIDDDLENEIEIEMINYDANPMSNPMSNPTRPPSLPGAPPPFVKKSRRMSSRELMQQAKAGGAAGQKKQRRMSSRELLRNAAAKNKIHNSASAGAAAPEKGQIEMMSIGEKEKERTFEVTRTTDNNRRQSFRSLADGWGRTYYQDIDSQEVVWELPANGDVVEDLTKESKAQALQNKAVGGTAEVVSEVVVTVDAAAGGIKTTATEVTSTTEAASTTNAGKKRETRVQKIRRLSIAARAKKKNAEKKKKKIAAGKRFSMEDSVVM